MPNLLKHLPKLRKRDKVSDTLVMYRGIIDGKSTPCFRSKSELYTYVADQHSVSAISSLIMHKITLQTLIH